MREKLSDELGCTPENSLLTDEAHKILNTDTPEQRRRDKKAIERWSEAQGVTREMIAQHTERAREKFRAVGAQARGSSNVAVPRVAFEQPLGSTGRSRALKVRTPSPVFGAPRFRNGAVPARAVRDGRRMGWPSGPGSPSTTT